MVLTIPDFLTVWARERVFTLPEIALLCNGSGRLHVLSTFDPSSHVMTPSTGVPVVCLPRHLQIKRPIVVTFVNKALLYLGRSVFFRGVF